MLAREEEWWQHGKSRGFGARQICFYPPLTSWAGYLTPEAQFQKTAATTFQGGCETLKIIYINTWHIVDT